MIATIFLYLPDEQYLLQDARFVADNLIIECVVELGLLIGQGLMSFFRARFIWRVCELMQMSLEEKRFGTGLV